MRRVARIGAACALALAGVEGVLAQADGVATPAYHAESVSPFGAAEATEADAAALKLPALAFTATPEDEANFEKYYYFHRTGTDFAAAYADIRECDGYARGLASGIAYQQTPYPYAGTMAGAVGGVVGNMLAAAIFGSAEKRRVRRVNMRSCMHFKGYSRYGLSKVLWEPFNFEEGISGVSEKERDSLLKLQALVAATATPQGKELGL